MKRLALPLLLLFTVLWVLALAVSFLSKPGGLAGLFKQTMVSAPPEIVALGPGAAGILRSTYLGCTEAVLRHDLGVPSKEGGALVWPGLSLYARTAELNLIYAVPVKDGGGCLVFSFAAGKCTAVDYVDAEHMRGD